MYYFDWDENKNRINLEKHGIHGITFEEASTVFFDDRALLFDDPEHSMAEDRFLLPGMSETANHREALHCVSLLQRIRHSYSDYFSQAGNEEGGRKIC